MATGATLPAQMEVSATRTSGALSAGRGAPGGATELASHGVPEARIAEQGRWKEGSMQLPKYVVV